MAEWAALPTDILVLIAKPVEIFEDYYNFYAVCRSWHSVTSILVKFRTLPSRFPWVMLTDKAEINFPKVTQDMDTSKMLIEQVGKNQQIQGMQNRQFYSFSASKVYEFELPEATCKKCLGVGYGLLLTLGFDLQINILNPFTRQQILLPDMLSFKNQYEYGDELSPQELIEVFVRKVAMSSNPFINQSNDQDCIIMAIYGERQVLAFARPGDKVWTDICLARDTCYLDIVYYNGKFYGVDGHGGIDVYKEINDAKELKSTFIACGTGDKHNQKYLVESSGNILLLVIRRRKGTFYGDEEDIDEPHNYTIGFSIFKLEKCDGDSSHNYPYIWRKVNNLGNKALFIGNNASVSVPCSRFVKGNSIYFSDDEVEANSSRPWGSGYDTGIYDVESGNFSKHYASKFMSHLTPPIWIIT